MSSEQNMFGVNVWWTVPTLVVDGQKSHDVLDQYGFDKSMIKLPTRRTEVSRAARSFQNRLVSTDKKVTEKVKDDGNYVSYGILELHGVNGEEVEYKQGTTVRLNKDTDEVTAEGNLASEVLQAVHDYTGKITDDDVRSFLRGVIKMCYGVSKRPSGGIYFIPARFVDMLELAQDVLNGIGGGARLYVERVMDGVQERQNVWGSVEDAIEQQVNEALMSVDRIERSANAVKSHAMKLEGLDELMDVYKELLGEEAKHESIVERIEGAVKVVQDKMVKLQEGTASVLKSGSKKRKVKSKVVEAAVEVLKASGKPMNFVDITHEAIASGLYSGECADPAVSMNSAIGKAINRGDERIVRVRKGTYALA